VAAVSPLAGDNEFFLHAQEIEYDEDQCRASDDPTKLTTERLHMIEWYGKWQKAARLRVNSYLQQRPDEHVGESLPLHITVPLCRLLRSTECLSEQFTTRTWKILEGGDQHLDGISATFRPGIEIHSPVTMTERARMQRAFFRFHVCNLFHDRPGIPYESLFVQTMVAIFEVALQIS
jgi:hypothetical protein